MVPFPRWLSRFKRRTSIESKAIPRARAPSRVEHMRLPDGVDRDFLFRSCCREEMLPTGIGWNSHPSQFATPCTTRLGTDRHACFLETGGIWGASTGSRFTRFSASSVRTVRRICTSVRLSFMLQDKDFKSGDRKSRLSGGDSGKCQSD